MCYLKKNDHKVYYCHTLKITRYIRSTLLYTLTYMQILRNTQQQNNATIFEDKEMGAVYRFLKFLGSNENELSSSTVTCCIFFQISGRF